MEVPKEVKSAQGPWSFVGFDLVCLGTEGFWHMLASFFNQSLSFLMSTSFLSPQGLDCEGTMMMGIMVSQGDAT